MNGDRCKNVTSYSSKEPRGYRLNQVFLASTKGESVCVLSGSQDRLGAIEGLQGFGKAFSTYTSVAQDITLKRPTEYLLARLAQGDMIRRTILGVIRVDVQDHRSPVSKEIEVGST